MSLQMAGKYNTVNIDEQSIIILAVTKQMQSY